MEPRLQSVAERQAVLEQGISEVEHVRAIASRDKVPTLEPFVLGDD
jgi:hypothetical protein